MPNPDISSQYDTHTSWQHIWRLSWPIMLSNITAPLVGVVDVAVMGRLNDPAFVDGVGLGMMAVLQGALLWLGKPLILGLITSQADLIAFIDACWIWVAMLPLASFLAFQMDGVLWGPKAEKKCAMQCWLPLQVLPQQFS